MIVRALRTAILTDLALTFSQANIQQSNVFAMLDFMGVTVNSVNWN